MAFNEHSIFNDPNTQLQVAFTFWLHNCCLIGPEYSVSNDDLLEDFGWCRDNYGFLDFWLGPGDLDTLLAWAGFIPELRPNCIMWHGIGRRFDYWDPEESASPYPIFPKILG